MIKSNGLLRAVQICFWAALIFTFVSAVMPARHAPHLMPWDKAMHFTAFYVLTVLATAAFPNQRLIWIAVALSAFGASIEIVQGLKIVARDRDFWDWVADTIAIAAAQGPLLLVAWRTKFSRPFRR